MRSEILQPTEEHDSLWLAALTSYRISAEKAFEGVELGTLGELCYLAVMGDEQAGNSGGFRLEQDWSPLRISVHWDFSRRNLERTPDQISIYLPPPVHEGWHIERLIKPDYRKTSQLVDFSRSQFSGDPHFWCEELNSKRDVE